MTPKTTLRISTALALVATALPVAAWAAPGDPAAPAPAATAQAAAPDAQADGVPDVVVTANRREQNLQNVPIAITAIGSAQMEALNIKGTTDVPLLVPGFTMTRTLAGANAYLRGVGTTNSGFTTETPVAVYIDGLYLPNSAAAVFSFNDIERIEVLKGPQGTLYGRNTTGGLIHVITKDPSLTTTAVDASASYGNYDPVNLNFYGSTPLGDNLAANIAATYTHQGKGWGRNLFTGSEQYKAQDFGLQMKLIWKPGPNTKITLRGMYDRSSSDEGIAVTNFPGSFGIDGSSFQGKYTTSTRFDPNVLQRQFNGSIKIEQDVGFARLTSITGYVNNIALPSAIQNGIAGNPVAGQSQITLIGTGLSRTYSEELQLASRSSTPFEWIVGVFYYNDYTKVRTDVSGTCIAAVCAAAPVPTRTTGYAGTRSYSAYGEGTYKLTDSTRLTLGLRYTSDQKNLKGLAEPLAGFPNSVAALAATAVLHPGDPFTGNPTGIVTIVTFNKLTWRAVLAQDLTPDIHAYVSYNRGFKAGGFNPISFTNPVSRPEVLDSFEGGIKSSLFDRMLRFNVAAFYYNYKDIQLRTTAPPAPAGGSILYNAAAAHIKGIDFDFDFVPTRALSITGGAEFLDAKYSSFPGGTCINPRVIAGAVLGGTVSTTCDLAGRQVVSAPKFSYNLGATYTVHSEIGSFALAANDSYKSSFFFTPDNRIAQNPYHVVSASLTWTATNAHLSVQGWVKNLTNSYYFAAADEGTGGNDVAAPGAPRTYGMTLRYKY